MDRSQVWWPIGSGGPPGILSCNVAVLPNLANILPDLCTVTVQPGAVAESFEVLRRGLMVDGSIRRVERFVDRVELPEDVPRKIE